MDVVVEGARLLRLGTGKMSLGSREVHRRIPLGRWTLLHVLRRQSMMMMTGPRRVLRSVVWICVFHMDIGLAVAWIFLRGNAGAGVGVHRCHIRVRQGSLVGLVLGLVRKAFLQTGGLIRAACGLEVAGLSELCLILGKM